MKTEVEILEEKKRIVDAMIKVAKSEGVDGFRFVHLAVSLKALEWVIGKSEGSPMEMDELFDKVENLKHLEGGDKILGELKKVVDEHGGGRISRMVAENEGEEALENHIAEILRKRKGNITKKPKPEDEPSFHTVLEKVEASREIKTLRKDKDVTKTKEFKALASKLGIKI